ncbi:MAG: DUF2298 domain-containing protein, partial [Chloroflexaceae bacterium]|nr:DUF2298 domain-containing protein [Chloroflexaceae bacterium]
MGLLAALLAALAVMSIQQSHFYVDPIFSTFFTLVALYAAVRVVQDGSSGAYVLLGLGIGFAAANRITLASLGLIAIVAAVLAALPRSSPAATSDTDAPTMPSFWDAFLGRHLPLLFLAGLITLLTFRVVQPYAFVGSTTLSPLPAEAQESWLNGMGFFDIRPDPRFLDNMQSVQRLVSGQDDFYPSQQWVNRVAYLFPWSNMVIWGMGPLLGLTAWGAWLLAGWHVLRAVLRDNRLPATVAGIPRAALVLWVWVGFYFGWQGGQFAITMRYVLPLYGALVLFTAWLLVRCWDHRHDLGQHLGLGWLRPLGLTLAVTLPVVVVLGTLAWAYAFSRIYTIPHSRVQAAHWVLDHVPPGSYLTTEGWDDPLPLQVRGPNPWGTSYFSVDTQPYSEDEPGKYFTPETGLLDQLEQADYVVLTSNRVYDSTRRLPMRYPATMRYYHHLFAGNLGFELVADIHSYPRLFGIDIPDQSAEEAFTVYDHPRVLIFQKTPSFSRERAAELITGDVHWDEIYKSPVAVADRAPTALRLTESAWPWYRNAGTWSASFHRESLVNAVAPLLWLVVVELLGLAMFALLFWLLPWLPDRGWSLAKALALLLVAWAAWWLGSLRVLAFGPLTVWLCALPLLLLGAGVAWRSRQALRAFWQQRGRDVLTAQAIYLLAFVLLLVIRWYNPDLWHPARGGEKPMDFAYLNATLQSGAFPPYDPWHAGGFINYYYFGFVIVGTLIHLTTVVPAIAYNIAVALLFALTALGAWGVIYNLLAPSRPLQCSNAPSFQRRLGYARAGAALAPVLLLLLGNMAQAWWFISGYAAEQTGRPEWAFWDATRIIPGTVNEFPFFTFLFADLHAHMIVMPFSLALLGLTVALARFDRGSRLAGERQRWSWRWWLSDTSLVMLLFLALLGGTLRATNTWDYPTYIGLTVITLTLIAYHRWRHDRHSWRHGLYLVGALALVVLGGSALFLPFVSQFATNSSGIELFTDGSQPGLINQVLLAPRTTITEWLLIAGLWLFVLLSAGLSLALDHVGPHPRPLEGPQTRLLEPPHPRPLSHKGRGESRLEGPH